MTFIPLQQGGHMIEPCNLQEATQVSDLTYTTRSCEKECGQRICSSLLRYPKFSKNLKRKITTEAWYLSIIRCSPFKG